MPESTEQRVQRWKRWAENNSCPWCMDPAPDGMWTLKIRSMRDGDKDRPPLRTHPDCVKEGGLIYTVLSEEEYIAWCVAQRMEQ